MTSPERVCRSTLQAAVRANTRFIRNVAQLRSHKITVARNSNDPTECLSTGTYGTVKQHEDTQ